jgi:hypothetical protein
MEEGSVDFTLDHVRSEEGSCCFSYSNRISTKQAEKKAVVNAAQMTCFENGSYEDWATLAPRESRKGNVTTCHMEDRVARRMVCSVGSASKSFAGRLQRM